MHNNDQIEEQATQKWQYYSQGILRNYSNKRKQLLHDFWTDYEQLLAQVRQQQKQQQHELHIAQPVATQAQAIVAATTAEYAYLPWVKLMVPYWDELPLKLQYHSHSMVIGQVEAEGCGDSAKSLGVVFLSLGVFFTFAATAYIWSIIFVAALIAILTVKIPDTTPKSLPTIYYSYEFSPDYLTYEKKTVYTNPAKQNRVNQLQIPYRTIGYIYTEEDGVRIQPKSGAKWKDSNRRYHDGLTVDQRIVAFNEVASFLRDVINANYANKNRQP